MPPERARALIGEARRAFAAAGIETAALDARLLLQHVTGLAHEEIAADPERAVAAAEALRFRQLAARREAREPVSRILGEREFHGRSFAVTQAVLDPRPDTETLIDAALALRPAPERLLELGTGSGAIIVTLLAEWPAATGLATDLSAAALAVAERNAGRHKVNRRAGFVHGDWFAGVDGPFDLILSNPPYIPSGEIAGLAPDVRGFDPLRALDGGPDGLEAFRRIAAGANGRLAPGGAVLVEIGAGQSAEVEAIFAAAGLTCQGRARDLSGHIRCLNFSKA
ncbi:MAG: peptide chain release factor N(5)-glutamine methyltransferase [Hyphomicrobiales bacterium]